MKKFGHYIPKLLLLFILWIFTSGLTPAQDIGNSLQGSNVVDGCHDSFEMMSGLLHDKITDLRDKISDLPLIYSSFRGRISEIKSEIKFPKLRDSTTPAANIIGLHFDNAPKSDGIQSSAPTRGDFVSGSDVVNAIDTSTPPDANVAPADKTDAIEILSPSRADPTQTSYEKVNSDVSKKISAENIAVYDKDPFNNDEENAIANDNIKSSKEASENSVDLWISKTADQSVYDFEQNITYTITYGNRGKGPEPAVDVWVEDILPNLELYYEEPLANQIGNVLRWNIGTLYPGESGLIIVEAKLPAVPNLKYEESSSVYGKGFVNIRNSLSTVEDNNSINNTATIYGSINGAEYIKSAYVKVRLKPGGVIKNSQHGSGYYKGTHISSLDKNVRVVSLNGEILAEHESTAVDLPKNRTVNYNSKWSDRTSAKIPEKKETTYENYQYMDKIGKTTSFSIAKDDIIYSSRGNFSGGIAEIGYVKDELNSMKNSIYISETYHGNFSAEQNLNSYGNSPTYSKYASGIGFASSDKKIASDRRSYEYGSGSYQSAEILQANTIHKNSSLIYLPNSQHIGTLKIDYADKWNEGMSTRNPDVGSEISNRISTASYIQKEALMSPSYLSMTGRFNGTDYLRIKQQNESTKIGIEQVFIGDYRMDTTISFSQSMKYITPHINITKRVLSRDGNTVIYRINVTNDGNKTLEPVIIVDLLPERAIFISSTLKPELQDRIVSWSLLALPIGDVQTIDLKTWLEDISPAAINRVKAFATYQNQTLTAEAASDPYKTILTEEEKNETEVGYTTGDWRVPSCIGLNLSVCDCEKEIDEYYDNLDQCRYDCP